MHTLSLGGEGDDTILYVLPDCLRPRLFWKNCSSGLGPCEDYTVSFSVSFGSRGEHGGPLACEWGAAARRCCELIKGCEAGSISGSTCSAAAAGKQGPSGPGPRPGGFPADSRRTGKKVLHQDSGPLTRPPFS